LGSALAAAVWAACNAVLTRARFRVDDLRKLTNTSIAKQ
jgi:hypothetical protein